MGAGVSACVYVKVHVRMNVHMNVWASKYVYKRECVCKSAITCVHVRMYVYICNV